MKVNPCRKCGSVNVIFRDCGYSSFNCGTGKCECGNEMRFNNLSCFGAVPEMMRRWNDVNSIKYIEAEIVKCKEALKVLNKDRRVLIKAEAKRGGVSIRLESMLIPGVVLCSCGGQVISNSGKVFLNMQERKLSCWKCKKTYDMEYAYSMRKEGETVTLDEGSEV